ncbi:hypothetical protein J2T57_001573 [Natronocella acetinitrilica]|uniref:Uncharacterized protein n=1 Tax=Natronocella acetinitrilica TaxID=414046 RepID=A0AAE3G491_9GAMM|nr:hypothetical protein [Natronocella acetinitrilica]MCP1674471.1 hypothetical protein [Natronocella acetinitrilica]
MRQGRWYHPARVWVRAEAFGGRSDLESASHSFELVEDFQIESVLGPGCFAEELYREARRLGQDFMPTITSERPIVAGVGVINALPQALRERLASCVRLDTHGLSGLGQVGLSIGVWQTPGYGFALNVPHLRADGALRPLVSDQHFLGGVGAMRRAGEIETSLDLLARGAARELARDACEIAPAQAAFERGAAIALAGSLYANWADEARPGSLGNMDVCTLFSDSIPVCAATHARAFRRAIEGLNGRHMGYLQNRLYGYPDDGVSAVCVERAAALERFGGDAILAAMGHGVIPEDAMGNAVAIAIPTSWEGLDQRPDLQASVAFHVHGAAAARKPEAASLSL